MTFIFLYFIYYDDISSSVSESEVDSGIAQFHSVKDSSDWFKLVTFEFLSLFEWFINIPGSSTIKRATSVH